MSKEIRKYFESAEEMHKAFTEEKKVYRVTYESEIKPKYYQIKDGIICSFDAFNDKMLGIAHGSFTDCKSYFTFEKPVLKMQIGKKYKTRDGEKVCCFYKYKSNVYDFNWAFIKVNEQPDRAIFKSRDNGRQWSSENAYHGDDIVDYWEE